MDSTTNGAKFSNLRHSINCRKTLQKTKLELPSYSSGLEDSTQNTATMSFAFVIISIIFDCDVLIFKNQFLSFGNGVSSMRKSGHSKPKFTHHRSRTVPKYSHHPCSSSSPDTQVEKLDEDSLPPRVTDYFVSGTTDPRLVLIVAAAFRQFPFAQIGQTKAQPTMTFETKLRDSGQCGRLHHATQATDPTHILQRNPPAAEKTSNSNKAAKKREYAGHDGIVWLFDSRR